MKNIACCCALFGALLFSVAGLAAEHTVSVPLAASVKVSGRCTAIDLLQGNNGVLLKGSSAAQLAAGRYRLHVPLALAPVGDLRISALAVTIKAGEASRVVSMLHFPVADEFTDLPLDFTAMGGSDVPISITWALAGEQAKKNREQALQAPKGPDEGGDEEGQNSEAIKVDDSGRIALSDLRKITCHLAAGDLYIEPLSSLAVTTVTTDKIVYKPGEKGTASVTVTNYGAVPAQATLTVAVVSGLQGSRPTGSSALAIPPGESRTWSGPFETSGLHWGAELQATARGAEGPETAGRAIFGVTDNFWETSINSGMMFSADFIDPQVAENFVQTMRDNGYTQMESGFWAPDEFGCFTPKQDMFFGGQHAYRGSVTGTKNVLAALHKRGMYGTVYSNLWGGDGYESYEQMRQHPDWFTAGGQDTCTDWMENWPLMFKKKIPSLSVWPYTCVIEPDLPGPLEWHAKELVGTHRQIGWDGVRYDSYDAVGEGNIKATKIVRELVDKEEPSFRWGYNSSVPKEAKPESLDIMCRGGQLIMEEGLRHVGQGPGSLTEYLKTLAGFRDTVWQHGGNFGLCYDAPMTLHNGTLLDQVYMCCCLLAAGSHPYYGQLDRTLGDFPGFALRYSEYLYNNKMRPLPAPEKMISIGGDAKLFEWTRLVQQLDLGEGHRRLVLQLLNPPAVDITHQNLALKTPAPLRNLPVSIALPPGAKVTGAWALNPIPTAHHVPLTPQANGAGVTLTVPEVRFWTVLVVEYTEVGK